jgi:hypothetical protein
MLIIIGSGNFSNARSKITCRNKYKKLHEHKMLIRARLSLVEMSRLVRKKAMFISKNSMYYWNKPPPIFVNLKKINIKTSHDNIKSLFVKRLFFQFKQGDEDEET